MERDSILYRARRSIQVMAHKFLPDEFMSRLYFRVVLKKKLELEKPQTFNEKMQWLKLYHFPYDEKVIKCSDKYAVREYIEEKGYGNLLVPLLGHWESAKSINWDELPNEFVLKCNHGCAYNILCDDKNKFDYLKASKQLEKWMREDFGAFNIELHYSKINPHVITCEEYLGENITDYKFFCFNGEPKFIYVSNDLVHDRQAQIGFFYLDGKKMPIKRSDYSDIKEIELPLFYEDMHDVAKELCKGFPFVRVDFFIANNTFYFAELTFTPSACMMPINPSYFDREWGEMLVIDDLINAISK